MQGIVAGGVAVGDVVKRDDFAGSRIVKSRDQCCFADLTRAVDNDDRGVGERGQHRGRDRAFDDSHADRIRCRFVYLLAADSSPLAVRISPHHRCGSVRRRP